MGEKYDGVRFCWVPALSSLYHTTFFDFFFKIFIIYNKLIFFRYTRTGGKLEVPESFYNHFPPEFLDGEAW